jgi:hypothetical protein
LLPLRFRSHSAYACVCVLLLPFARGQSRSAGGQHCRTAAVCRDGSALHSPACTLRAPSAARPPAQHRALPVSGQSGAVHVSLCRWVISCFCALGKNLRAPNRTPRPSHLSLRSGAWLALSIY